MKTDISSKIAQLRTLSRQQLLDMWQKLYQKAAPHGIRRELIVPFLAYRMQENVYGSLKPSTRSELRHLARSLEKSAGATELKIRPRLKPGTRLLRQWHGGTHEVVATASGYDYRGTSYRSLSKIACRITGTRWSGPAFFGLKKAKLSSRPPR